MKSRKMTGTLLPLLALVAGLALSGPAAEASVPSTIAFQGYLTDSAGVPVDGTVSMVVGIYSSTSNPTPLWTETQPAVTVTDGVFSMALGAVTPIHALVFSTPNRFVGIRVNGEAELPRTQLRTAPFAFQAAQADTVDSAIRLRSPGGATMLETGFAGSDFYLTVNNSQSAPCARLGAQIRSFPDGSNGQLELLDEEGHLSAVLTAGVGGDGRLELLGNGFLAHDITLTAGASGDGSVQLPPSAIAAVEMLDEPGVASNNNTNFVALASTTPASVISRSLTPPGDGFVLALGQSVARITHTNGTATSGAVGLSDDGVNFGTAQDMNVALPGNAPSGSYSIPAHVNGVFPVSEGVAKTIHLVATEATGDIQLEDLSLTLLYVPTSYGTVVQTLVVPPGDSGEESRQSRGPQTAAEIAAERVESGEANLARVAAELAAMQARIDELRREVLPQR